MNKWNDYIKKTVSHNPRSLLVEALNYVKQGKALDLGCGAGNDSRFLKERGFEVVSVDSNEGVKELVPDAVISSFDTFDFSVDTYDLINAQYALPFNSPNTFDTVFSRLTGSLKSGGIFTGQFFGKEDSWSNNESMTFQSEDEIRRLLAPYKIHLFREEKKEGKTAMGETKFWHVFDAIAEKK